MATRTDNSEGTHGDRAPATVPSDSHPPGSAPSGVTDEVRRVVQAAVEAVVRAGTVTGAGVTDALESAARTLTRRVVSDSTTEHPGMGDRTALARALADKPRAAALGSATAAALALKFAGRFRRLGFVARRSPAFLLATAVPALVASVTRGADELGMVSSHLVHRARAEGVEADPERVRRAATQIMSHRPVDPEVEPSHGALVVQWLRRALRAALPFTAGVATADPDGLASAAAAVDPRTLGPA